MDGIPNIDQFIERLDQIQKEMEAEDFYNDRQRSGELSREHQKLTELVGQYRVLQQIERHILDNQEMLEDPSLDKEMKCLAESDLQDLLKSRESFREKVLFCMITPDPSDSRDTIIEIRAGAGGSEASIFAADLFRMYQRYAEEKGWRVAIMGSSTSDCGYKEISFSVKGQEVYKTLKYESGVHRVQRVPETEASGRIHTSTATVAVLPEAEEVDVSINPNDLEIKVCRASGPGGQCVNTTDSAVQILYKPTGMIVTCADERSQLKNKNKAMTVLRSRILKQKQEEERAKYDANRKDQVGTGDRSERIRTYNFTQGRVSDHRINLTQYNLPEFVQGNLQSMLDALEANDKNRRVKALLECPR